MGKINWGRMFPCRLAGGVIVHVELPRCGLRFGSKLGMSER